MALINLTMNDFKVPGLAEYTPPFGEKRPLGKGLTTREVNDNIMMPFTRQRAVQVVEDSDTGVSEGYKIEAYAAVEFMAATTTTVTLTDGLFSGVTLKFYNPTEVVHKIAYGAELYEVSPHTMETLVWYGGSWSNEISLSENDFEDIFSEKIDNVSGGE